LRNTNRAGSFLWPCPPLEFWAKQHLHKILQGIQSLDLISFIKFEKKKKKEKRELMWIEKIEIYGRIFLCIAIGPQHLQECIFGEDLESSIAVYILQLFHQT